MTLDEWLEQQSKMVSVTRRWYDDEYKVEQWEEGPYPHMEKMIKVIKLLHAGVWNFATLNEELCGTEDDHWYGGRAFAAHILETCEKIVGEK